MSDTRLVLEYATGVLGVSWRPGGEERWPVELVLRDGLRRGLAVRVAGRYRGLVYNGRVQRAFWRDVRRRGVSRAVRDQ